MDCRTFTQTQLRQSKAAQRLTTLALSIEEFGTPAALAARTVFEVLVTGIYTRLLDWPIDMSGAALGSVMLMAMVLAAFSLQNWIVTRRSYISQMRALRHITLPLMAPSLIAAMTLVFAIASRELVGSIILAPAGLRTVGTFVFSQFEQGSVQTGMAMSLIAITITSGILLVVNLWLARQGSSAFS